MEYVLITGGTSGIGYELAKCFKKNGYGVVIVGSDARKLERARKVLSKGPLSPVIAYEQDLSEKGSAKKLYDRLIADKIEISILVNNAGFGLIGPTHMIDFEQDDRMMYLNMITLVELCKLFLPRMYERGKGKIFNVASMGAYQPGPYTSTYFACKSFVLNYSRAIRQEAKKYGVQVSILCPGTTKTLFFLREGVKTPWWAMQSKEVSSCAYEGLMQNKEIIIPGVMNKILRFIPANIKMYVIGKMKKEISIK